MFSAYKNKKILTTPAILETINKTIDICKNSLAEVEDNDIILLMSSGQTETDTFSKYLQGKGKGETNAPEQLFISSNKANLARNSFPIIFTAKNHRLFLTYPPLDRTTKGAQKNMTDSIALEATLKKAKEISGLLIIIDYKSFLLNDAQEVHQLFMNLMHLVKTSHSLEKSVIFAIINKPASKTNNQAQEELNKRINGIINKLNITKKMDESTWWTLLKNNLIIINFFEQLSLVLVNEALKALSPIPLESFNFTQNEKTLQLFSETTQGVIREISVTTELMQQVLKQKVIIDLTQLIADDTARNIDIEGLEKEIADLREEITNIGKDNPASIVRKFRGYLPDEMPLTLSNYTKNIDYINCLKAALHEKECWLDTYNQSQKNYSAEIHKIETALLNMQISPIALCDIEKMSPDKAMLQLTTLEAQLTIAKNNLHRIEPLFESLLNYGNDLMIEKVLLKQLQNALKLYREINIATTEVNTQQTIDNTPTESIELSYLRNSR